MTLYQAHDHRIGKNYSLLDTHIRISGNMAWFIINFRNKKPFGTSFKPTTGYSSQ
jgi:hypothetical protein